MWEATCLGAPGDAVEPAVLLSIQAQRRVLGSSKPAQFLFNVPEGFARLVLEHRVRPGTGLRAVMATNTQPGAVGGIGGLILRLKQDGHGQVELLGPRGLGTSLEGVAEFVHWKHPHVTLRELQPTRPSLSGSQPSQMRQDGVMGATAAAMAALQKRVALTVAPLEEPLPEGTCYEDDLLQVAPLWHHDLLWKPPGWMTAAPTKAGSKHSSSAAAAPPASHLGSARHTATQLAGDRGTRAGRAGNAVQRKGGSHANLGSSGSSSSSSESSSEEDAEDMGPENGVGKGCKGAGDATVNSSSSMEDSSSGEEVSRSEEEEEEDTSSSDSSSSSSRSEEGRENELPGKSDKGQEAGVSDVFSKLDQLFAASARGGRGGYAHAGRMGGSRGGRRRGSAHCRPISNGNDLHVAAEPFKGGMGPLSRQSAVQQGLKREVLSQLRDHAPLASAAAAAAANANAGAEGGVGVRGSVSVKRSGSAKSSAGLQGVSAPKKRKASDTAATLVQGAASASRTAAATAAAAAAAALNKRHQHPPKAAGSAEAAAQHPPVAPLQSPPPASGSLTGYVCHIRGTGTLLLLLCVPSIMLLASAQQHPCLSSLTCKQSRLRRRVAAVLHLTPHHVANARPYQQWLRGLPRQQVLVGHGCSSSSSSSSSCTATATATATHIGISGNKGLQGTVAAGISGKASTAVEQGNAAQGSAAIMPDKESNRQVEGVPVQTEQRHQQQQNAGADAQQQQQQQNAGVDQAQGDGAQRLQHQQARQFVDARLAQLKLSPERQRQATTGGEGLGFLAAARVTARLNLISPLLFPLPYTLLHSPCPAPPKPSAPQTGRQPAASPHALENHNGNSDVSTRETPKPNEHIASRPEARSAASPKVVKAGLLWKLSHCAPSTGAGLPSGRPLPAHLASGSRLDGQASGSHSGGQAAPPVGIKDNQKAALAPRPAAPAAQTPQAAPTAAPPAEQGASNTTQPAAQTTSQGVPAASTLAAAPQAAPAVTPTEQGAHDTSQPPAHQACFTTRACPKGMCLLDIGCVPAAADVAALQMELLETLGDPLVKQLRDLWQAAPQLQHDLAACTFAVPQPQRPPPAAALAPTATAVPTIPGRQQQQQDQQHQQQQDQQQQNQQNQQNQQDQQQKRQRREQQGCVQTHRYQHSGFPPHHAHLLPYPPHSPPPSLTVSYAQPLLHSQQSKQPHGGLPGLPHLAPHPTHSSFASTPGIPQAPPHIPQALSPPVHSTQGYYVWVPGTPGSAPSPGSHPAHLPPLSFPDPFHSTQGFLNPLGLHPHVAPPHPPLACPPSLHHRPYIHSSQLPSHPSHPPFPTAHASFPPHLPHQSQHQPISSQASPAQKPQPPPSPSQQHPQPTQQQQSSPYHLQHPYLQHQQQTHPHKQLNVPLPPPAPPAHPPVNKNNNDDKNNNRSAAERLRASIKGGGSSGNGTSNSKSTPAPDSAPASHAATAGTAGSGSKSTELGRTANVLAPAYQASAAVKATANGVPTGPQVNGPHGGATTQFQGQPSHSHTVSQGNGPHGGDHPVPGHAPNNVASVPPSTGGAPNLRAACGPEQTNVPTCLRGPLAEGTALMFLGTGSAEPSKYRSGSAILLKLPGSMGSLLMDCGEGSWGQMLRCLGPKVARQQVAALRCIWVSHKHADHALGLSGLLAARPASAPPLLVVGPWAVKRWMERLHGSHGYRTHFMHCREFRQPWDTASNGQQSVQAEAVGPQGLGLVRWQSVPVDHCPDAYALVMEHQHGWKLVYSGDTRPCPALVRAGAGATLLIHEATFEPELENQAVSKRHSTSAEALQAAKDMKAYSTILTHFSQRYPRVPAGLGLESESEDPDDQEMQDASGGQPSQTSIHSSAHPTKATIPPGHAAEQKAMHDAEQGCGHCVCGGSVSEDDELEGDRENVGGPGGCGKEEEVACVAGEGNGPRQLEVRSSEALEDGVCSMGKREHGNDVVGAGGKGEDHIHAQQQQQQQQCQSTGLDREEEAQGLRTAPAMVAFDGMLVPLSMLPHLPMMGPLVAKVLKRAEQLQEKQEQELLQQEQKLRHEQSLATLGMNAAA